MFENFLNQVPDYAPSGLSLPSQAMGPSHLRRVGADGLQPDTENFSIIKAGHFPIASIIALMLMLSFTGCIKNDIPLPYQPAAITAVEAEGALEVVINEEERNATLVMDEVCDLSAVTIRSVPRERRGFPAQDPPPPLPRALLRAQRRQSAGCA